ncbi:MAG TPA: ROK family protein [Gaiellaceae bacterium]|jgi:glucokinase|nr:ROK family protein [Gaiellaceae bacterium]
MRAGVDLGGTKIDVLLVEREREVLGRMRRPTPTEGGAAAVVAAIARTVADAADASSIRVDQLTGVGVGSPGAVDTAAGTVGFNSNLAGGWVDPYPFAEELARRVGTRVRVANDVATAAAAELELGAGRGLPSFLAVWWGTGLGGSVVLAGRRWDGNGAAGELGHTVVKLGGRICPCGRRGCAEAYAGRAAMENRARQLHERGQRTKLFELMRKANRDRLTSGVWERALREDDRLAHELIDDAYDAIAAASASVVNLLDIDGIVLGGGLGTRFGPNAAERIHAKMRPHIFNPTRDPPVIPAELGDDGGAIGAALLVQ